MGSETSQYHEEKRLISISLVAASENEKAQTQETRFWMRPQGRAQDLVKLGGCKAIMEFNFQEVTNCQVAEAAGKRHPRE